MLYNLVLKDMLLWHKYRDSSSSTATYGSSSLFQYQFSKVLQPSEQPTPPASIHTNVTLLLGPVIMLLST